MRIGVVTLPGRFNYGNRLQNYASVKIYEELGFQADSLILDDYRFWRKVKMGLMGLSGKSFEDPERLMTAFRLAAFDSFNQRCNLRVVCNKRGA